VYEHNVDIETAIGTFFRGIHWWNSVNLRFECNTDDHCLFWAWLHGDETASDIFVITCFPQDNN